MRDETPIWAKRAKYYSFEFQQGLFKHNWKGVTMAKPLSNAWIREHQDDPEHGPSLTDPEFFCGGYPDPISDRVPKHLRKGGVGRLQRPKECHHYAYLYMAAHSEEPGIRIVYGTLTPYFVFHSWVEVPGNISFDPNRQVFYETDTYRAMCINSVIRVYTAKEAHTLVSGTRHSGPWTEADCLRLLGYVPESPD